MGPPGPDFGFDQSEYAQQMEIIQEEPTHEFEKGLTSLQQTPFEEAVLFEAETSEEPSPPLSVPLTQLFRPSHEPSPVEVDRSKWSSRTNIVLKALERKLEKNVRVRDDLSLHDSAHSPSPGLCFLQGPVKRFLSKNSRLLFSRNLATEDLGSR
jgi:hypothetical protein